MLVEMWFTYTREGLILLGTELFILGSKLDQGILVEFSSAQQSARNNCYKVEDADHMEVCKPPSKAHPSYALLLQFIITCGKVSLSNLVCLVSD